MVEGFGGEGADIAVADADGALGGVEAAEQEVEEHGFPGAGGSGDAEKLSVGDGEVDVLEDGVFVEGEGDVFKGNAAGGEVGIGVGVLAVGEGGLFAGDVFEAGEAGASAEDEAHGPGEGEGGPLEDHEVLLEFDEDAEGEFAADDLLSADPEQGGVAENEARVHEGPGGNLDAVEGHVLLDEVLINFAEGLGSDRLDTHAFDDADALEGFLAIGGEIAEFFLHAEVAFADRAQEEEAKEDHDG